MLNFLHSTPHRTKSMLFSLFPALQASLLSVTKYWKLVKPLSVQFFNLTLTDWFLPPVLKTSLKMT